MRWRRPSGAIGRPPEARDPGSALARRERGAASGSRAPGLARWGGWLGLAAAAHILFLAAAARAPSLQMGRAAAGAARVPPELPASTATARRSAARVVMPPAPDAVDAIEVLSAEALPVRIGDTDAWVAAESHPDPASLADLPDARAATAGGGATGGPVAWTRRLDDITFSRMLFSDPTRTLAPRVRTAAEAASPRPEIGRRAPVPGFAGRGASAGRRLPSTGGPGGLGHFGPPDEPLPGIALPIDATGALAVGALAAVEASPRIRSAPAGRRRGAHGLAVTETGQSSALADRGTPYTVADEPGAVAEDADVAEASDRPVLGPLEATRPAAGGTAEDVAGPSAGVAPVRSLRPGATGAAATRANVPRGDEARLRERERIKLDYVQRVYAKVNDHWSFPRPLALALEQGRVVIGFTIERDGRVYDVRVVKSSGFAEFDAVARAAVERAAPFAPVPPALGGAALSVDAPFQFDDPLVR